MDAARELFIEKGFADTGTPEIVAKAGVTRGALYHQFADKTDLFSALIAREAEAVERAIGGGRPPSGEPWDELEIGARAYFEAMAFPGRSKLLLVMAPAVLGTAATTELTNDIGVTQLHAGLAAAPGNADRRELDAVADVLSAAFDRAALAIAEGADEEAYVRSVLRIIRAVVDS